jgi:hypothetical protein
MSQGRRKPRRNGRSASPAAPPPEQSASPQAADHHTFVPNPPRRNLPLLALSIVLLILWLAALSWLAVQAWRDNRIESLPGAAVGVRSELVKKSGEHGKHNLKSCHCLANAAEERH